MEQKEKERPGNLHDKGYKRILKVKENFLEFLQSYVPLPGVSDLTVDDLHLESGSFVAQDMEGRETDIIYRVRLNGINLIFFILLELQSTVDFTMVIRFLQYTSAMYFRMYRNTPKSERERQDFKLPVIVPIVYYNGEEKWTSAMRLSDRMEHGNIFKQYVPDFEYILIDLNGTSDEQIAVCDDLISCIMLLDKKFDRKLFMDRVRSVGKMAAKLTKEQRVELTIWVRDVWMAKVGGKVGKKEQEELLSSIQEGSSDDMTYAFERFVDELDEHERKLEAEIAEKDEVIAEKDEVIAEKDAEIARLKSMLGQKRGTGGSDEMNLGV